MHLVAVASGWTFGVERATTGKGWLVWSQEPGKPARYMEVGRLFPSQRVAENVARKMALVFVQGIEWAGVR